MLLQWWHLVTISGTDSQVHFVHSALCITNTLPQSLQSEGYTPSLLRAASSSFRSTGISFNIHKKYFEVVLDSKIPAGSLEDKWTKYRSTVKLVSPSNKRKLDVIVIGTGLAGASAASSLAEL